MKVRRTLAQCLGNIVDGAYQTFTHENLRLLLL